MPMFTVVEVQEVTQTVMFTWEVEAADAEQAKHNAMNANGKLVGERAIGDRDYGTSGFAVVDVDGDKEEAIDIAEQRMIDKLNF